MGGTYGGGGKVEIYTPRPGRIVYFCMVIEIGRDVVEREREIRPIVGTRTEKGYLIRRLKMYIYKLLLYELGFAKYHFYNITYTNTNVPENRTLVDL